MQLPKASRPACTFTCSWSQRRCTCAAMLVSHWSTVSSTLEHTHTLFHVLNAGAVAYSCRFSLRLNLGDPISEPAVKSRRVGPNLRASLRNAKDSLGHRTRCYIQALHAMRDVDPLAVIGASRSEPHTSALIDFRFFYFLYITICMKMQGTHSSKYC